MTKRTLLSLLGVGILILGGGLIVRRNMQLRNLEAPLPRAIPVRTAKVVDGSLSGSLETVALIQSDQSATVGAQVPGSVLEVRVREGDSVIKGQMLALIDNRTLQDGVDSADARSRAAREDLAKQEAIFRRDQALFQGGAIAQQALDISRAQLESVRAAATGAERATRSARTALGYARVTAPYSGIVRSRLVEPGDLAMPGKPLFALQLPGPVRLLSKLSQEDLGRVAVGGEVTFSNGSGELKGRITRIYPALDASRLGSVETALKSAPFGLMPGATIHARYHARPAQGLLVPGEALLQGLSETLVVRVRNGQAEPVPVTVLSRGGMQASISGSLQAGDEVVVALPSELMSLTKGMPIQLVGVAR